MDNEITIKLDCNYQELCLILNKYNFRKVEKYFVDDIYMIPKNIDLKNKTNLEILAKCILIRDIPNIEKKLVYKKKKYGIDGQILSQKKIECSIEDIKEAYNFMKQIGYKKIFSIHDESIVYINNDIELTVQIVNDKHIFIEIEQKFTHLKNKIYSINELKKMLEKYDLPYNKNNYFVSKASLMLDEVRNTN